MADQIPTWNGVPLRPLSGGYGGETFAVGEPGDPSAAVLRIYGRDPLRGAVDAALLRLVRGVVPVPEVIESRPAEGDLPGILVTEWMSGRRLDEVLDDPATPPEVVANAGVSAGMTLARLSGICMPEAGFFADASLSVLRGSLDLDLDDFLAGQRDESRIGAWSDTDFHALQALADEAQALAETPEPGVRAAVAERRVLVHSDFNAKNILVDPGTGEVTALLDWEFAHAGSPYHDLGNMLRFRRDPAFTEPLIEAFITYAPPLRPEPVALAYGQDLWARIELAGRTEATRVTTAASELLLACAREGDAAAWPWPGRVVPPGEGPI